MQKQWQKGEMDKSELGVKALDEHTVEFTLARSIDYFIDCLKVPGYAPIQKKQQKNSKICMVQKLKIWYFPVRL